MNSLMRYGSLNYFADTNCCLFPCLNIHAGCQSCFQELWELKVLLHFSVSQVWLGYHGAPQLDDPLRGTAAEPWVCHLQERGEPLRPQRKSQCRRNYSCACLLVCICLPKCFQSPSLKDFKCRLTSIDCPR